MLIAITAKAQVPTQVFNGALYKFKKYVQVDSAVYTGRAAITLTDTQQIKIALDVLGQTQNSKIVRIMKTGGIEIFTITPTATVSIAELIGLNGITVNGNFSNAANYTPHLRFRYNVPMQGAVTDPGGTVEFRDDYNGLNVFSLSKDRLYSKKLLTDAPSSNGAGVWRLGKAVSGGIEIEVDGITYTLAQSAGGGYTLPIATGAVLGGVKIGSGLSVTGGGVLSANPTYIFAGAYANVTGIGTIADPYIVTAQNNFLSASTWTASNYTLALVRNGLGSITQDLTHTHPAAHITSGLFNPARMAGGTASSGFVPVSDGLGNVVWQAQTGVGYTFTNGIRLTGTTVRNDVITGISGGNTWTGGTSPGDNLFIRSTSDSIKGQITMDGNVIIGPLLSANPTLVFSSQNPGMPRLRRNINVLELVVNTPGTIYGAFNAGVITDKTLANANSTNWTTAFGWGDHSTMGYLTNTTGDARYSLLAHTHAASAIVSGIVPTARLGTGTANSTTFLRGDGTWSAGTGGGLAASGDDSAAVIYLGGNAVALKGVRADTAGHLFRWGNWDHTFASGYAYNWYALNLKTGNLPGTIIDSLLTPNIGEFQRRLNAILLGYMPIGSSVNIFNSNGTLTGNRALSANSYSLTLGSNPSYLSGFGVNLLHTGTAAINIVSGSTFSLDSSKAVLYGKDSTLLTNINRNEVASRVKYLTIDTLTGKAGFSPTGTTGGSTDSATSKQTFTTGTTISIGPSTAKVVVVYYNPASIAATATLNMPASPVDGQEFEVHFGGTMTTGEVVTTLTINAGSGKTIGQSTTPANIQAYEVIKYRYNSTNTTYYRN